MLRPYETFKVVPWLPPRLTPLRELAYNLWWTWNLDAVDLFMRLDRDLWEESQHNPVRMLGRIRQERLLEAVSDDGFVAHLTRVHEALTRYMSADDTWYQQNAGDLPPDLTIAYFAAEFGLTESMKTYSGGLGVLSGDHLKSASDLGLPLVGVGLLYQEGYFQQYLNADGWQQESYPQNDFYSMPIRLQRDREGQPLVIEVEYPGRVVKAQVWWAHVGRVALYLLNTNIEENALEDRAITNRLYGGYEDMRIRQEIMLGIGGMRALRALGVNPTVCHMNEGHSSFLGLERVGAIMRANDVPFSVARLVTSAGTVFTTHTPVPAGIDLFPVHLMDHYFTEYYQALGLQRNEFLHLGQRDAQAGSFSMAILALRLADQVNGVSELHGQVAREMWHDLWPAVPVDEVPITSITNGVHSRSWISRDMAGLFGRYLGPSWVERPWDPAVWDRVQTIPDEELWRTHERRRERLVAVARERLRQQIERRGATPREVEEAREVLDPETLTVGFARRFATYKRAALLFQDPERLARILNDPQRPVQIIFSGKAHPHDNPGKELIRQIVHYAQQTEFRHRIIFLEDYDMVLARYLVQGVDVWLNTPRPGLEASGTSGMKAAMNGALNCSTVDGWWVEGYSPDSGWAIGQGERYEDVNHGDAVEARALYSLLEQEIVPLFYDTGNNSLPRRWISHMKGSIRRVAPRFNTHRMVQEYFTRLYAPAARRYRDLSANGCRQGRELAEWLEWMQRHWSEVQVVSIRSDAGESFPVNTRVDVEAQVALGSLAPDDVTVSIYYGSVGPQGDLDEYEVSRMTPVDPGCDGLCTFRGTVQSTRSGLHGYTVRVSPQRGDLSEMHAVEWVLWSN